MDYAIDTTVDMLIKKGITLYLSTMPSGVPLRTVSKVAYDLRVCDDGGYRYDEDIPPLTGKKNIRGLNVEALVLVRNERVVEEETKEMMEEYLKIGGYVSGWLCRIGRRWW